jgi:hypothetical protein
MLIIPQLTPLHQASIVLARIFSFRRNVAIVGGSSYNCWPSCMSAVEFEPTRSYLQWIPLNHSGKLTRACIL